MQQVLLLKASEVYITFIFFMNITVMYVSIAEHQRAPGIALYQGFYAATAFISSYIYSCTHKCISFKTYFSQNQSAFCMSVIHVGFPFKRETEIVSLNATMCIKSNLLQRIMVRIWDTFHARLPIDRISKPWACRAISHILTLHCHIQGLVMEHTVASVSAFFLMEHSHKCPRFLGTSFQTDMV